MTEIKKRLIKWLALPLIFVGIGLVVVSQLPIEKWRQDRIAAQKEQELRRKTIEEIKDGHIIIKSKEELEELLRKLGLDPRDIPLNGIARFSIKIDGEEWELLLKMGKLPEIEGKIGISLRNVAEKDDTRAFSERVITRETFLYDKDGKSLRKLESGKIVRLLIPEESLRFEGFSEKCIRIAIPNKEGADDQGYVRESTVSDCSPQEYWKRLGMAEGVWWNLPLEKDYVAHKAVKLQPGQLSEFFTLVIKERIKYYLVRPNKDVQFQAWINGQEVRFRPGELQQCPDFNDFVRVRVQLSEFEGGPQTIRFFAQRAQ